MENWNVLQNEEFWKKSYDYLAIASFGYMVPSKLINFCNRALNMHPSLLPKYRGSSPIPYSIANLDDEVGVTIQTVSANRFDAGKIVI